MVQLLTPLPVAVVLATLPVQVLLVVPDAAALPRLVVQLVMSVATLARIDMVLPATGAVRDVSVVLV